MYFISTPANNISVNKFIFWRTDMETKAIIKGMAAGAVVGTACYMISRSPDRKKKKLKRSTGKAVKAFITAADCFSSMI